MVNKPLIKPYFLGGVALGGVARIPLMIGVYNLNNSVYVSMFCFLCIGFVASSFFSNPKLSLKISIDDLTFACLRHTSSTR